LSIEHTAPSAAFYFLLATAQRTNLEALAIGAENFLNTGCIIGEGAMNALRHWKVGKGYLIGIA
jgi:hypothetical protein